MPPPRASSVLNVPAPDASVSAFHVDAAVAWSAVAAAPPTLSRAAPTSTPGSGAPYVAGPSAYSTMIGVASTEASS